jgi:hypothetical protein
MLFLPLRRSGNRQFHLTAAGGACLAAYLESPNRIPAFRTASWDGPNQSIQSIQAHPDMDR